MMIAKKL